MSKIMTYILKQEEAGRLVFNEETRQYESTTECNYCHSKTGNPFEDAEGEAICIDCYTDRQDRYKDSFDDMFGESMETLNGLGVRP